MVFQGIIRTLGRHLMHNSTHKLSKCPGFPSGVCQNGVTYIVNIHERWNWLKIHAAHVLCRFTSCVYIQDIKPTYVLCTSA